eukprot:1156954-Pelagomonas_calceolata.AAC.9
MQPSLHQAPVGGRSKDLAKWQRGPDNKESLEPILSLLGPHLVSPVKSPPPTFACTDRMELRGCRHYSHRLHFHSRFCQCHSPTGHPCAAAPAHHHTAQGNEGECAKGCLPMSQPCRPFACCSLCAPSHGFAEGNRGGECSHWPELLANVTTLRAIHAFMHWGLCAPSGGFACIAAKQYWVDGSTE